VSPIIATILLVAITVVLAAVLYVLISGLTHGTGSAPIGSAFAAGNPVASNSGYSGTTSACSSSTTAVASAIKAGDWTYTLTVESSSVSFGSIGMEVKTSGGSIATSAGGFYIVNTAGNVVACGAGSLAQTSWTYPTSSVTASTPLTTLYTIVIDTGLTGPTSGVTTNPWTGLGYSFIGVGVGSYSGTTSPVTLP
jgi:flagellin-like protein